MFGRLWVIIMFGGLWVIIMFGGLWGDYNVRWNVERL